MHKSVVASIDSAGTARVATSRLRVAAAALVASAIVLFAPWTARAATFYVAPNGSDTAAGTMAAPFASWARAQTAAAAGDTVYFRGGTYAFTAATTTCNNVGTAIINAVVLSKSGTAGNPIRYWAFPGETPVFDFSGISDTTRFSCRQVGVRVEADWLHLKGLELKGTLQLNNLNHESWCVYVIGGNNNTFEMMNAHHNMGPGFFVQQGGNNTFLNCDSHENEDTLTSNGDGQSADGFGCHPNHLGDTGNLFHGCRAWWNSDDGWDFINASEACTVEYSWAWYGGYKPDQITAGAPFPLPAGNGNGFKGGGYGDPQVIPASTNPTIPQHVIRFNASFFNKANGVYANHEIVSPLFYNNTSYNNGIDFDMLGLNGTAVTSVGTLRNNLAFGRTIMGDFGNAGPISDMNNSWDTAGFTVTATTFQSLAFPAPASCPQAYLAGGTTCVPPTDTTTWGGMASARNADGSLPVLPFLRLSTTVAQPNNAIDKGVNVNLPFSGAAPDLGAFENGLVFDGSDGGTTGGSSSSSSSSSGGSSSSSSSSSSGGGAVDAGRSSSSSGGAADAGTSSSSGASSGGGTTSGSSGAGSSSGGATSSSGSGGSTASSSGSTTAGASSSGSSGGGGTGGGQDGGNGFDGTGNGPSGCGCQVPSAGSGGAGAMLLALGLGVSVMARRRRSDEAGSSRGSRGA